MSLGGLTAVSLVAKRAVVVCFSVVMNVVPTAKYHADGLNWLAVFDKVLSGWQIEFATRQHRQEGFVGYTKSMKTAISIPDDVFEGADLLAHRTKKSRSQLFTDAVKEYVARHGSDEVTDAMDRVCGELGNGRDEFVSAAARRVLERSEW